jgi:hypothetical protein
LWFWGHVWDDLYLATGAYAEARRADGHADSDTTICLSLVLTGLHQLLSSSTAYLDTAWEPR